MSNTIYIDANATNSRILNDKNNRYRYKLPNSMELPTGTEIALQNSIVNLQGITGASIEIPENIEETICFQYYSVDTSYLIPTNKVSYSTAEFMTQYDLLVDMSLRFNHQSEFGNTYAGASGFSENIMPLVQQVAFGGERTAIPMCGRARIKIDKGVYSISKLSELITRQINFVEDPDNPTQSFYEKQKLSAPTSWGGVPVSNTTSRIIKVEESSTWASYNTTGATGNTNFYGQITGALKVDDTGELGVGFTTIAVTQETNQKIIDNAVSGGFGVDTAPSAIFDDIIKATSAENGYFLGFEKINNPTQAFNPDIYNLFDLGVPVGTTNFTLSYDTVRSGFSIDYLHQPRQIPTHDRFGTSQANAGQMCCYMKRPSGTEKVLMTSDVFRTVSSIVQATSGVLVYNWGFDTCLSEGDKTFTYTNTALSDDDKKNLSSYRTFDDFFSSTEKRNKAWEKTIWYKMGFAYDDIQSPKSYRTQKWYDKVNETPRGFTTTQDYDSSIIPSISSIYNSTSIAKGDAEKAPDAITPLLDSISGIQVFGMYDANVPKLNFNNNKKQAPTACVVPYSSSFYQNAVMLPVLTKGKTFTASRLPILSQNGYLLILSDLVEPTDIMKNQVNQGLLDIIPKTNLSNQDFVSERNVLIHTLSNPKVFNEININILNPDLTDIQLEPNSAVLIRITLPSPKPTVFLSTAGSSYHQQIVEAELQKNIKDTASSLSGNNLRLDITPAENELLLEVEGIPAEEAEQIIEAEYQDVVAGRHRRGAGGGSAQQREHEPLVAQPRGDPEPSSSAEPPRKEEFERRAKESTKELETSQALISQLERRRREARGDLERGVPGRKPKIVRDLNQRIQELSAEIRKNEEIVRGFRREQPGGQQPPAPPEGQGDIPQQAPAREI